MLRLDKVIKPWKESAALNDHINLYGFWNETAFLTKSGDLGMVLSVPGVDYESLDRSQQEYAVKRLEAALKAFGPGFHVYQYLFKSNRPDIPFATYDDPIVEAAIDQRRKFFEAKRDHLYQVEIFYCIVLEGARSKTGVGTALARLLRDPEGAIAELKSQFTNDSMKKLLRTHIERDLQRLDQHVRAFARQLADFMQIEVLNRQGQFTFFRRLLNYDDWRVAGRPQSTQFLDYQVVNSDIEAERDHLRVGNHIVRVLTMKEAITETRPLVLDALLKIPANFYVVTEWTPLPADKARKEVNKRRRHFNMSKTGFVSQMGNDATKTNPRDVLVDESKQADIENLGDCLRALGDGQSLGDFSLTIVLYGRSRTELDQLGAEFTGTFTNADGNLFAETYNQLNAYFAAVPGYALNLRRLYVLNTNYADLSFLFTILPGEKTNAHLGTEYLAVVETDNSTPYFLNLHSRDGHPGRDVIALGHKELEMSTETMSVKTKATPEIIRAAERYLEQYGDPLVMNTYLKVTILVLGGICISLAALTFKSQQALANMHPMIVRINDVGHAEAIDYRNFQYRPQEAENKYYLTRWTELYFSRNRFTIERDQTQSLYFLNSDVQRAVIDQERKDNSIQNYVKDSSLPYIDVEIKNVILDDMRQSPYSARIEFEKVYTNPADHSELKRERWTASVTYVFRENVKNNELAVNPLGLTIVRFRADQAFS